MTLETCLIAVTAVASCSSLAVGALCLRAVSRPRIVAVASESGDERGDKYSAPAMLHDLRAGFGRRRKSALPLGRTEGHDERV